MFDNGDMVPSPHLKTISLQTVDLDDGFFRALNFDFPMLEHFFFENEGLPPVSASVDAYSHIIRKHNKTLKSKEAQNPSKKVKISM